MTEQPPPAPSAHALAVVMRDYLSYGESGMADLKEAVHSRKRKPVLNAFCQELRKILAGETPVPVDVINKEFQRRAEEDAALGDGDGGDAVHYDDQQAYEALADLWEYLDLTPDGEPEGADTSLKAAARKGRSQLLWVDGDPVHALKTWMSWRSLALFVGGSVVCTVAWAAYRHVDVGFLRGLLLLLTIAGFATAGIGGGALWLRRVRYVNPDAFLPAEEKPKEERR
ncbi:hypothetical protein GCM10011579_039630 [Streptomyces albiflavescens]|uniref:Uncharacterized protein n=1 Tax=Streptomyces albiflavescens TaxID=1623582 RepID=A0A918D4T0_9ACTN|nr:hypothetical protein [Streptomyces albiflavescens]GGN67269.1 hypothetical protein GCM10011579_039630 [Streptomyces albiflavescens]